MVLFLFNILAVVLLYNWRSHWQQGRALKGNVSMKIGIKCFSTFLLVAHGHVAENLQSLIFTDQSDGESARKTEEMCENFSQLYLPS